MSTDVDSICKNNFRARIKWNAKINSIWCPIRIKHEPSLAASTGSVIAGSCNQEWCEDPTQVPPYE